MRESWVHDIVTEHAALTTTGGMVWDAARRLCSFLEEMGPELGLFRPGLQVLELGAGLGWLGMTLARNLTASKMVVLTEQEEGGGLDWLRHNLALNAHLPGMKVVRAAACDWRHYDRIQQTRTSPQPLQAQPAEMGTLHMRPQLQPHMEQFGLTCLEESSSPPVGPRCLGGRGFPSEAEPKEGPDGRLAPLDSSVGGTEGCVGELDVTAGDTGGRGASGGGGVGGGDGGGGSDAWLLSQRWDFIIGSDLVYNTVGTECLPRVMRALAGPETCILYCHTRHRFDTHDMEFFSQLTACGLIWREVREPSVPTPPQSPPPLTELFPEMRIAIYDIRLGPELVKSGEAVGQERKPGGRDTGMQSLDV
ncbi:hypothetical protein Vretimale_11600 [Volvox reticuliferus]|uniref:Uncharacterized protein n=1 Tax=Volvox reticuliferus TaxID=1737510 RepID=A0A8J4CQU6_9CHLO|nr:hypothetical protein Vretifemale_14781 [Volvox reticuliferus]GIM07474.1 hypothetical protein Vretimale_11600 [Volvox reticuliferus]